MSQTYNMPMASSATLSASRVTINDAHAAHQSGFSGTSAPGSAVAGQFYFNTSDNGVYWTTDGSTFYKIFTVSGTYGDLVPRVGGSGYAMSGDLYMGSNKVKSLASPADSGDAATKGWSESTFLPLAGGSMSGVMVCGASLPTATANPTGDTQLARKAYVDGFLKRDGTNAATANLNIGGYRLTAVATPSAGTDAPNRSYVDGKFDTTTGHDHDGSDSKKVPYANLDTTGATVSTLIQADGSAGINNRHMGLNTGTSSVSVTTAWTDIISVTCHAWSGETKWIFFGFIPDLVSSGANLSFRILRDATTILSSVTQGIQYTSYHGTGAADPTNFRLAVSPGSVVFACSHTAPAAATFTWKLQGQYSTSSGNWELPWIFVL